MKSLMTLALAALSLVGTNVTIAAADIAPAGIYSGVTFDWTAGEAEIDRKGRRPRVPGGSGCDSPRDVREHPECRA